MLVLGLVSLTAVGAAALASATTTITTREQFMSIRDNVAGSYVLGADISLDQSYAPVDKFTGSLDGNHYSITLSGQTSRYGLFGTGFEGSVRDLTLHFSAEIDISNLAKGTISVGALVGTTKNAATISSVVVDGSIELTGSGSGASKTTYTLGGVIGTATDKARLSNIVSSVVLTVSGTKTVLGGVVGTASGASCTGCFYSGTISGSNMDAGSIGGIYGETTTGQLANSAFYGKSAAISVISTGPSLAVGGLVGRIGGLKFAIDQSYAEFSALSLTAREASKASLGGLVGLWSVLDSDALQSSLTVTDSYVSGNTQKLEVAKSGSSISYVAGFVGFAGTGNITVSTSYVKLDQFSISGAGQINATLSVSTHNINTALELNSCYLEVGTVSLSGSHAKTSFGPIANLINTRNTNRKSIQEVNVRIGQLAVRNFQGYASMGIGRFVITGSGSVSNCLVALGGCDIDSSSVSQVGLFYGSAGSNPSSSFILANVSCRSITQAYVTGKNPSNVKNYFNSDFVGGIQSDSTFIGVTDDNMRKASSYPDIDQSVWQFDNVNVPYPKKTPHYHNGGYLLTDNSKWVPDKWAVASSGIMLVNTAPPTTCDTSALTCSATQYVDKQRCQCVEGCPNLQNGQCTGPGAFVCDAGYKPDTSGNCLIYSCATATNKCPLAAGSGSGSGSTIPCNESLDVCVCPDRAQYYDFAARACIQGCPGLKHGICTGVDTSICDPGWVTDGSDLCARYDCTAHTDDSNKCGGPSIAICSASLRLCVCAESTYYYNANERMCQLGCQSGVQYGVCTGQNEAICKDGVSSPSNSTPRDRLCSVYSCENISCGSDAVCDSSLNVCKCNDARDYFDLQKSTCVSGCPSLMEGICTGDNTAKCKSGFATTGSVLCNQYSCVDDTSDARRHCGGLGSCINGRCRCTSPGAVLFLGTCKEGLCKNGDIRGGVCVCHANWSSPSADDAIAAQGYCSVFNCPTAGTVGTLSTATELVALKLCPTSSFRLVADISMAGTPWTGFDFAGTLDGDSHTLNNLVLEPESVDNVLSASLFKALTGASLRNINFHFATSALSLATDATVTEARVGLLAISADAGTTFDNVALTGTLRIQNKPMTVGVGGVFYTCPPKATSVSNRVTLVCENTSCNMGGYCHSVAAELSGGSSQATLECSSAAEVECVMGGFAHMITAPITGIDSAATLVLKSVTNSAAVSVGGIAAVLTGGASASHCVFSGVIARGDRVSNYATIARSGGAFYKIEGTESAAISVTACSVETTGIAALEIGGFVGTMLHGNIDNCSVVVSQIAGVSAVSGFVQYAGYSTITRSFVHADMLIASNVSEQNGMVGGFAGIVANCSISSTYTRLGTLTTADVAKNSMIGGFVGVAYDTAIKDSFVQATRLESNSCDVTSTKNAVFVGGFAGSLESAAKGNRDQTVANCFADIESIDVSLECSVYLGGFVGRMRKSKPNSNTVNTINSVWVNTVLRLVRVPQATTGGVGMFAGKVYNNVTLSNVVVNGTISYDSSEDCSSGVDASSYVIGLFNGAKTADKETKAQHVLVNVTPTNFNSIDFSGSGTDAMTVINTLVNGDLLPQVPPARAPGVTLVHGVTKTAAELRSKDTYKSFGVGTSTSRWTKLPGQFPILTALPAKMVKDGEPVYIFSACELSTCWDYANDFWLRSAQGLIADSNIKDCPEISGCMIYADNCACKQCDTGKYLRENSCLECTIPNCLSCSSVDFCDVCTGSFVNNGLGVCTKYGCDILYCQECTKAVCSACSSGSILADASCTKCAPQCTACSTAAAYCTKCNATKYNLEPVDGRCQCKDGFYAAADDCLPCDETCKTCSGSGANSCLTCNGDEIFDPVARTCTPRCTLPNCLSCPDRQTCTTCAAGFDNIDGVCLSNTECRVTNCQTCVATNMDRCASCQKGFYLSGHTCQDCPSSCASCSSALQCTSCKPEYVLADSGRCILCFVSNCLTCSDDNVCAECADGYYNAGSVCARCGIRCRTCTEVADKCTSCHLGYILSRNTCISASSCGIENCASCTKPDVCGRCNRGYYLSDNHCRKCSANCAECSGPYACTRCAGTDTDITEDGECVSTACGAIANCRLCDLETSLICYQCESNYDLVGPACKLSGNNAATGNGLSAGAIAGIAIVFILMLVAIAVVVVLVKKGVLRRKSMNNGRYTRMGDNSASLVQSFSLDADSPYAPLI